MSRDIHDKVKVLLILALVLFLIGALGRLAGYGNNNPIAGIYTPHAFHEACNTVILFAIGIAVYNIGFHFLMMEGKYPERPAEPAASETEKE